jgi:hypothetical protein
MRLKLFNSRRGQTKAGRRNLRPCLEALEGRRLLTTYTVTNTNDSGAGSLRQAILNVNNDRTPDTITFAIPGTDVPTIRLASALPYITTQVVIDGTTQSKVSGTPFVELRGPGPSGSGTPFDGLMIGAANSTVQGLMINRFNGNGVSIEASNVHIVGNLIGTNAAGATGLGNSGDGIRNNYVSDVNNTIGGTAPGAGNVIASNGGAGIYLTSNGNVVQGNFIGTNAAGATGLGNATGVLIFTGSGDTIGGTAAGAGNTIAYNTQAGVALTRGDMYSPPPSRISILSNRIFSNSQLGIDLLFDRVTPNTPGGPHSGPNNLQNYPVITSALVSTASTTIAGTLNSAPSTSFTLQFFASAAPDRSGFGQGEQFLGQVTATTDRSGNASFSASLPTSSLAGQCITATATDPNGNTSEFSQAVFASLASTTTMLTSSPNPSVLGQQVTFTASVSVIGPGTGTPTGLVAFMDGATTLGTAPLSAGVATFSTSTLSLGTHAISAVYLGDSRNAPSSIPLSNGQKLNPVAATQLVVTTPPPGSVATGTPFSLTVTAEDGAGNVTTSFNAPITVALVSDLGGATLVGTLTATAINGVATFTDLALNRVGGDNTLLLSGGGLSVATGNIATTAGGTVASHQFYSTAEKQVFLDLATAYALRAARLTAIAAATPSPLDSPINALAAYYWFESQTYAAIANDPPDSDFTTVAPPENPTVAPLTAGGGITQAVADAFNALLAEQAQALGLAGALGTALDRAQAAASDPANADSEQKQLAALTQFSRQLGAVVATEPGLLANVQAALQASGVVDVSVSPADIANLQRMVASAGLPVGLVQALQQLTASSNRLKQIQLQNIQNAFIAQKANATAGSLSATLTDPAFNALIQASAEALMGTVLLSGSLTPASDSGVSHTDGITNNTTPTFAGTAPPGTTVQLFGQRQLDSTPVMLGQGISDATGQWQITVSHQDDGTYAISARFSGGTSGFGQVTPLTPIVIKTVGPRIVVATYNRKTGQVAINFENTSDIDLASLTNPAFFVARNGKKAKSPVLKLVNFQRVGTQITFTVAKGRTHPTSIYLQVISGGIQDRVGNALDGEFNGTFPAGDHKAGGDFITPLPIPKTVKPRKGSRKSRG